MRTRPPSRGDPRPRGHGDRPAHPVCRRSRAGRTQFVADPALDDESRLFAARCSTYIKRSDVGVGLLSQLIADPAFAAEQRVRAAVLLASLARLADAVSLGHGEGYERSSRAEAAGILSRLPGQLDAGAGRLLRIAQNIDGTVGVHHRRKAAEALGWHEEYRATAADLLAGMARDHRLRADERANAANFLSYHKGHEREVLRILQDIASRATEPFDHAASLAAFLKKRLEESG